MTLSLIAYAIDINIYFKYGIPLMIIINNDIYYKKLKKLLNLINYCYYLYIHLFICRRVSDLARVGPHANMDASREHYWPSRCKNAFSRSGKKLALPGWLAATNASSAEEGGTLGRSGTMEPTIACTLPGKRFDL